MRFPEFWLLRSLNRRVLLFLCLCVVFSAAAATYYVRFLFKPVTGLVMNFPEVIHEEGGVVFAPKAPLSPAVEAGLKPYRDEILRVAGREVQNTRDIVEADLGIRSFEPFEVEVLRDGRQRLTLSITPSFALERLDWFFMLVFSLVLGFTAYYLTLNALSDDGYDFLVIACLTYLVFTCVKPFYYESLLSNTLVHFGKSTAWLILLFALSFPTPKASRLVRTSAVVAVLLALAVFTGFRLSLFTLWADTGREVLLDRYRALGRISNIAEGGAYLGYLALLGYSYVKRPYLNEKRELEWLIAGFMMALPPYFFFDQLPLILNHGQGFRLSMGGFANLFLLIFPLFVLIGRIRQKALNFRLFLSRYAVYTLLALIVLLFFATLFSPLLRFFENSFNVPLRIAAFLVSLLLFIMLFPLRSVLIRVSEWLFFKLAYRSTYNLVSHLESRNRELTLAVDGLKRRMVQLSQSAKYRDMTGFVDRLSARLMGSCQVISRELQSVDARMSLRGGHPESIDPNAQGAENRTIQPHLERILLTAREIRNLARNLKRLTDLGTSDPSPVDVVLTLRSAVSRFRIYHPETTIRLDYEESRTVWINSQDLVKAVLNILDNSREAGPETSVYIRCFARERDYAVEIRDNGTGMSAYRAARAFRPFFTTKSGHVGLGLAISRMAIEKNAGTVTLGSREGQGTIVTLTLPLWNPSTIVESVHDRRRVR